MLTSVVLLFGISVNNFAIADYSESLAVVATKKNTHNLSCRLAFSNGVSIEQVLLAESKTQWLKGLSGHRKSDPKMLFVVTKARKMIFWMKNTPMDLSIGFFDRQGVLIKVAQMAANSLEYHSSGEEAMFALELAQGRFTDLKLSVGTGMTAINCVKRQ